MKKAVAELDALAQQIQKFIGGIKMAKKVNSSEFKSEVLEHKGVVLVDFSRPGAAPVRL